jgi:hypothetical protein
VKNNTTSDPLIENRLVECNIYLFPLPFGSKDKPVRIKAMDYPLRSHTPFAELSVEARVLFFIYASAAVARFGVYPPTPTQLAPQLEAISNEHKLCDEDLSDPDRLTVLLEEHLLPTAAKFTDQASASHIRCRRRR